MILDGILILIIVLSVLRGRKTGMFRMAARLVSFALSWLLTAIWGENVKAFLAETALYATAKETLTARILEATEEGKPGIFTVFTDMSQGGAAAEAAASGMLDMLLSAICFFLFLCLVRILIEVLDKTVLHLPLVRPVNALLGMTVSLLLTLCILYILAGALGGTMLCAESEFWRQQMETSYLFRGMYENNIVLDWILRKGEVA